VVYDDGNYEITDTELTQRFEPERILLIEKFNPDKAITAVYLDAEKGQYNIKRFKIETTSVRTKFLFIKEGKGNRLEAVTSDEEPVLLLHNGTGAQSSTQKIQIAGFVEVMGWKAIGNKLVNYSKDVEMEWETPAEEGDVQTKLF
jgi:topoisomerase-4 subunit A